MENKKPTILVILGPTASGKSELAIKIAQKLNGEIISTDSRQVYKAMNIGSGKVTKEEQKIVPHYMLDVIEPDYNFTVAEFKTKAEKHIGDILKREKLPILAGGTGLYIDAITQNLQIPRVVPDMKLRKQLEKKPLEHLVAELQTIDPEFAKIVDVKNKRRLIRALEVIKKTGKKFSALRKKGEPKYNTIYIGIKVPREKLRQLIEKRVDERIKQGMIEEVEELLKKGTKPERLIGFGLEYRFITLYLQGKYTKEEMVRKLKTAICQFAKRQMTWFRRNNDIHWISFENAASEAMNFLKKSIAGRNSN